jgi:hypothetical protein
LRVRIVGPDDKAISAEDRAEIPDDILRLMDAVDARIPHLRAQACPACGGPLGRRSGGPLEVGMFAVHDPSGCVLVFEAGELLRAATPDEVAMEIVRADDLTRALGTVRNINLVKAGKLSPLDAVVRHHVGCKHCGGDHGE